MKECYNVRYFPKSLKKFLEKETGSKLTKIRLLFPTEEWKGDIPFWRFRLEGIKDLNLGNRKVNSRFKALGPHLFNAYPNSLLRICKEIGWSDLVLDFSTEKAVFQDFSEPGFQASLDLSPEKLYELQENVSVLEILPPKKVLRRIRKNGNPN